MSPRATRATGGRVLRQLIHDRRTVSLLLAVPVVLLVLVKWVFDGQPHIFQRLGPPLVGIFPLVSMFLVTSITMLRERLNGTLERLMTLPLGKLDLLLGYAIAFGVAAAIQAIVAAAVAFTLLDLETVGRPATVVLLAVLNALLGMSLGLFVSAFARSEFEAVQFMPALILPQFVLSGVLVPRGDMLPALEIASWLMPMTYGFDALEHVRDSRGLSAELLRDVAVVAAVTLGLLTAGAATLRRRTE